jgi:hypothetical protein
MQSALVLSKVEAATPFRDVGAERMRNPPAGGGWQVDYFL